MKHGTLGLAMSVALGATLASAVRARAVQAVDAVGPTVLDEVTVTARKREEALQDIPLVVNVSNLACDGVLCSNGSIVNGVGNDNIDGNTLERQSKLSGSLLLTYSGTLGNALGLYSNVDLNYQDKQYLEALNLGTTSDRTLLNARVGLEKGRWDVSLWSRNLLDEKHVSNSFVVFFANSYVAGLGEARSYGLTVKYRL
jgi:outer membrane receptor protein involved in Fe transport